MRKNGGAMATKKEIDKQLKTALKEVGEIKPWFDDEVNSYVFEHPSYPVEYAGESEKEVIENYPKYLREFILHRLDDRLHPLMEKQTKGRGGGGAGAGGPKGATEAPPKEGRRAKEIAEWMESPGSTPQVRHLIARASR